MALGASPGSSEAQSVVPRGTWVGLWLGVGDGGRYSPGTELAFSLEGGYWRGRHMIFARRAGVLQPTSPVLADIGVLYGLKRAERTGLVYVAGGISYVSEFHDGVMGFPFEVGALSRGAGPGFGLKIVGNINRLSSFWGIAAALQFGRRE